MEETPHTPQKTTKFEIGPSEWLYIAGLVFLLLGLLMWLGLGLALTVCGGLLVLTALLNGLMEWRTAHLIAIAEAVHAL